MKTLSVDLSADEERALDRRAELAGCSDVASYVERLLRSHLESHRNLERFQTSEDLETALRRGLESGDPTEWNEDASRAVRDEVQRRISERRAADSSK